ncbi:MAG: MFS transporter [Chloroflexota bacterium]
MRLLLQNRQFFILWLVNVLSTLGLELYTITILVTVFEQTGSTLQTAGTMVARTLPAFILGPVAGVLVDRFARKNVLISMDVLRLILVLGSFILLRQAGELSVIVSYLILAGLSAADVFHRPASLSLIPSVVTQGQLVQANSAVFAARQILMAGSFAVGGWLVQLFTLEQLAIGILILFAAAILSALMLNIERREIEETAEKDETVWQAFVAGWSYLKAHSIARPLTIMETIEHVPHGIWTGALMLVFVFDALGGDTIEWGYSVTGYFTGMIVGSFIAMWMGDALSKIPGRIIVSTAVLVGFLTFAFAASPTIWIATLIAFIFGPPFAVRDVAQDALLQGTVEENQLGRVYATREMLRNIVFIFSGLFFAWLSEFFPIRSIYYLGGVLYLITAVYAVSNKPLRESRIEPHDIGAKVPQ